VRLTPPPGFTQLVPLDTERHRGLTRREPGSFRFARDLGAVPLTVDEFFHALRHYPIVFAGDDPGRPATPLALTALDPRHNLFVDGSGCWRAGCYVPALLRAWPFYAVDVPQGPHAGEALVCVDESGLAPGKPALFDASGAASVTCLREQRFVEELASAQRRTARFVATLADLGLLEPLEAQAFPANGRSPQRLVGLLRVSEARLNRIPETPLREMMRRGELARIYAHLLSLDNFADLLANGDAENRHGS